MGEVNDIYREALEDMVDQFACRGSDGKRRWLWPGGLSALEHAFEALGWDNPHYVEDGACEIDGCGKWASSTRDGIWLCSDHFFELEKYE